LRKLIIIPTLVSSFRILFLPLFLCLYSSVNLIPCLVLLGFSAATDYFDGYIARKLKASSRFGGYYDASTDFVFVFGVFAFFSFKGDYPSWLLILIAESFVLFLVSSSLLKKMYDPVGKYTGSALYIGIVLTLIFPSQAVFSFVELAFLTFFLVSIGSHAVQFARKAIR